LWVVLSQYYKRQIFRLVGFGFGGHNAQRN
jgi:hypothetical protein